MKVVQYKKPETIAEAYELLSSNQKNEVIGGGAWLKLASKSVECLISLDNLGLKEVSETAEFVFIGAKATIRDLEISPVVRALQGGLLAEAANNIMGINVRNIATIGGSVMGRFGFSDILTALLAMEAGLVFYDQGEIALKDYLELKRPKRDILLSIKIGKQEALSAFHKEARTRLDFAILNLAVVKTPNKITIAVGSRPMGAVLATNTMGYLAMKQHLDDHDLEVAAKMISEELEFKDNLKASAEYRLHLARVWSYRLLKAVIGNED